MDATRNNIEAAMTFDGMASEGGLAVMDIAINHLRARKKGEVYFEFGAYKGRSASLIARNLGVGDWLHIVESQDYLEKSKLLESSNQFTWHKEKSEEFCANSLSELLNGEKIVFTHHDASHFFDNVRLELQGIQEHLSEDAIIVLDDFNDSYPQVRAAYYFLRFTQTFPFELLLTGFNKAVLVHESQFHHGEKFVLSGLLDELRDVGITAKLVRTDNNKLSRNFFVKLRHPDDTETHYGVRFFGDKFYKAGT